MSATSFAVKLYNKLPNKKYISSDPALREQAEFQGKRGDASEFEHARYVCFSVASEYELDMIDYLDGAHSPWELRCAAIRMLVDRASKTSASTLPKTRARDDLAYGQKGSGVETMDEGELI